MSPSLPVELRNFPGKREDVLSIFDITPSHRHNSKEGHETFTVKYIFFPHTDWSVLFRK